MGKNKNVYFLLEEFNILVQNKLCFKLLRQKHGNILEDTNLRFDVDSEEEAIQIALDHINILGDSILDNELIVTRTHGLS